MKRTVVNNWTVLGAALFGTLALGACGGSSGDDDGGPVVDTGSYHHFVTNVVHTPSTSAEAKTYGLDIDGAADGEVDNALGKILATLKTQNVDIQAQVTDAVNGGNLILLHSVRSDDDTLTNDPSVSWKVHLGVKTAPNMPDFSGTGMFMVDTANDPSDAALTGSLTNGFFSGGPGSVRIQLSLTGGTPVNVDLIGARIESSLTADGCMDGIVGGAITKTNLDNQIIPAVADLVQASVADDGGYPCMNANDTCMMSPKGEAETCDPDRMLCETSTSKTILGLFDSNKDGMITVDEIRMNSLIMAFLEPDVDLLDASGTFQSDPAKRDGMKDSLSVGLGFGCVKGVFDAAGETPAL
jgi:hypothetical protein